MLAGLGLPLSSEHRPKATKTSSIFGREFLFCPCQASLSSDNAELFITADTIVWHQNKVFGKPRHHEEAVEMLRALSGCTHQVFTAVCLTTQQAQRSFCSSSEVRFCRLEEEEIRWYVEHYSPLDKAGAYGIQEWIGYVGVEHISGSYFNVMGLPVHRLYRELLAFASQAAG